MQLTTQLADALASPTDRDPADQARLAFLEWAFHLPAGSDPSRVAHQALEEIAHHAPTTAIREFRRHLTAATQALPQPCRRGGARARRMSLAAA